MQQKRKCPVCAGNCNERTLGHARVSRPAPLACPARCEGCWTWTRHFRRSCSAVALPRCVSARGKTLRPHPRRVATAARLPTARPGVRFPSGARFGGVVSERSPLQCVLRREPRSARRRPRLAVGAATPRSSAPGNALSSPSQWLTARNDLGINYNRWIQRVGAARASDRCEQGQGREPKQLSRLDVRQR